MFEGVEESVFLVTLVIVYCSLGPIRVSSTEVFNEAMMNDLLIDFSSQTFFTHSVCLESVA